MRRHHETPIMVSVVVIGRIKMEDGDETIIINFAFDKNKVNRNFLLSYYFES
jgi:hypothetical protein